MTLPRLPRHTVALAQAWYYGRNGQKLKQSTLAFSLYGLLFWLTTMTVLAEAVAAVDGDLARCVSSVPRRHPDTGSLPLIVGDPGIVAPRVSRWKVSSARSPRCSCRSRRPVIRTSIPSRPT